jgi:AcrR family transcriptional regulator
MATSCLAPPTTRGKGVAAGGAAAYRFWNETVPFHFHRRLSDLSDRGTRVPEKVTPLRPRVEGAREEQILDATVDLLLEVGYDRLTMDSVAARAKAGKATLYRRWSSKQQLVVDAVNRSKRAVLGPPPDTGSLRTDLITCFAGPDAIVPAEAHRLLGVVMSALTTDEEFASEFRSRFVLPRVGVMQEVYRRAAARGELRPDADLSIIGPALAAVLLQRALVLGEEITESLVERVVDQVVLPAATGQTRTTHPTSGES